MKLQAHDRPVKDWKILGIRREEGCLLDLDAGNVEPLTFPHVREGRFLDGLQKTIRLGSLSRSLEKGSKQQAWKEEAVG
jgi:hypothetical protein